MEFHQTAVPLIKGQHDGFVLRARELDWRTIAMACQGEGSKELWAVNHSSNVYGNSINVFLLATYII
jgi:hypothetical protein